MTVMLYKGDASRVFANDTEADAAMKEGWFDNPTDAKNPPKQSGKKAKNVAD